MKFMVDDSGEDEILEALSNKYEALLPLLRYLKARLKYDTVRWIRTYGTKDDIVFSTRIKTFERVYDKLIRKAQSLSKQTDILKIALGERGILDDLVGIRFICFDAYQIKRLVEYFLITERVVTSQREFYVSPRTSLSEPIYQFLQSHGFIHHQKPDREYEDINFIIRFSHPIDRYFRSGADQFASLAQQAQPEETTDKLTTLNLLFEAISGKPELVDAISRFPIECQVVSASQHIYNRAQRPHYEYMVQAKNGNLVIPDHEALDLAGKLSVLKLNLLAIDHTVMSIHQKFGIHYTADFHINPGRIFPHMGRLPKDILGENERIEQINLKWLPKIIDHEKKSPERKAALENLLKDIAEIDKKISERARSNDGDIAPGKLLNIGPLQELSHPEIIFWAFQRLILIVICVILLYTPDKEIVRTVVSSLKLAFSPERDVSPPADAEIVLGRLFEKLEHTDHAINLKLFSDKSGIKKWRDGYFCESIFSDPLIQWRYSSFMYRRREYTNALQETHVGIGLYKQLQDWKARGVKASFRVPEREMFVRRLVEYELCAVISKLSFNPTSVAGMNELCNNISPRIEEWNNSLDEIIGQSRDFSEKARALGFKILFGLCAVSQSAREGQSLELVRQQYGREFAIIEEEISERKSSSTRVIDDPLEDRTWWLLSKSVMSKTEPSSAKSLNQFSMRIRNVRHHPLERIQFEEVCAAQIALWMPKGKMVAKRNDFTANALTLLKEQTDQISQSKALNDLAIENLSQFSILLNEVRHELSRKGKIQSKKLLQRRLARVVSDALWHPAVKTAVAGLRSTLAI